MRFSCFLCVYSGRTVGPVPEHEPVGRGSISVQVHQGSDGHAWWVEVGEDVLLQSAWTWQEKQNQMFQACLCWRKEMLCS